MTASAPDVEPVAVNPDLTLIQDLPLAAHDVPARRLRSSGLAGERFSAIEDAVRWHGAVQAQEPRMAKWSLAQRCADAPIEGDVDGVLARGAIVRTHVLRPTWHFVAGQDLVWLLQLTGPRVQAKNRSRYGELGLDERTRARSRARLAAALEGGRRLTRKEIATVLESDGIDTSGQRLAYLLMDAELEAVICSENLQGTQHTYAALEEQVPGAEPLDRDRALVELTRRYLASHGPATVRDLGWWSGLTLADIRHGLDGLAREVTSEKLGDLDLWSIRSPEDTVTTATTVRGAYLLPAFDEHVVGYRESRHLGDPRADTARAAWRDRRLPNGVVLLDGAVAGHWRRRVSDATVAVEVVTYEQLTAAQLDPVESAAAELGRFVDRDVTLEVTRM